jgi:hypothetical protein
MNAVNQKNQIKKPKNQKSVKGNEIHSMTSSHRMNEDLIIYFPSEDSK